MNVIKKSGVCILILSFLLVSPVRGLAAEGKWITDREFVNTWSNYQITFPTGCTSESFHDRYRQDLKDFSICSPKGDVFFQVAYRDLGKQVDISVVKQFSETVREQILKEGGYTYKNTSEVTLGGYTFQKLEFSMGDMLSEELYLRPVGNHVQIMDVLYFNGNATGIADILEGQKLP